MDTEIERLTHRIDALEISLRVAFSDGLAEERRYSDERLTEARRHTQVLIESLHDDIRIVAEGVAALTVKIDRRS